MRAGHQVIYFVPVDWSLTEKPENAAFLADSRKYLAIRRAYPEIFEVFTPDHRDANIRRVKCDPEPSLTAYERYAPDDSRSVFVVPNPADKPLVTAVSPEFTGSFRVTDLLTGEPVPVSGGLFRAEIGAERIGVYLAERV